MYHPFQGLAETMGILLINFLKIYTKTNKEQWETRQSEKHAEFGLF
jgi:hypothetical protein